MSLPLAVPDDGADGADGPLSRYPAGGGGGGGGGAIDAADGCRAFGVAAPD